MRDIAGHYEVIIEGDTEHFVPSEETTAHRMSLTCECAPLMVRNVKGLLHRATVKP